MTYLISAFSLCYLLSACRPISKIPGGLIPRLVSFAIRLVCIAGIQ